MRQSVSVRPEVETLLAMGQLPNEDVGDDAFWEPWVQAVRAVTRPAADDEALAVLDVLPAGRARTRRTGWRGISCSWDPNHCR